MAPTDGLHNWRGMERYVMMSPSTSDPSVDSKFAQNVEDAGMTPKKNNPIFSWVHAIMIVLIKYVDFHIVFLFVINILYI